MKWRLKREIPFHMQSTIVKKNFSFSRNLNVQKQQFSRNVMREIKHTVLYRGCSFVFLTVPFA